jgi:hypothetical protein
MMGGKGVARRARIGMRECGSKLPSLQGERATGLLCALAPPRPGEGSLDRLMSGPPVDQRPRSWKLLTARKAATVKRLMRKGRSSASGRCDNTEAPFRVCNGPRETSMRQGRGSTRSKGGRSSAHYGSETHAKHDAMSIFSGALRRLVWSASNNDWSLGA